MNKTILPAEDDELNTRLFNDLLQANGYDTLQTGDGWGGIALTREHKKDLILMDVQLPTINGLEVAREIKSDEGSTDIPTIAVTAFASKGVETQIMESGFDGYFA